MKGRVKGRDQQMGRGGREKRERRKGGWREEWGRKEREGGRCLTKRKMVWTLPQSFPLALAFFEYMSRWDGIRLTATRLFPDNIQMITSGTQFWGWNVKGWITVLGLECERMNTVLGLE